MNIIGIISPLILVALLGFICSKSQWLSRKQLDAISQFTFHISIPAFLFYKMATANFSDQVSPQLFAAFYLPVLFCYGLLWLINYYFFPRKNNLATVSDTTHRTINSPYNNNAASSVFALSASYSNTIIVGLPILLASIGDQVIGIIFLIITFHSALLFGLTGVIAAKKSLNLSSDQGIEKQKRNAVFILKQITINGLAFLKQTFNNPLIISIFSGLLVNVLSIPLPVFIEDTLILLSKPAITLALFILGASLAFYQVRSNLKFITIACFAKLMFLPCLVLIAAQYVFQLEPLLVTVLVIMSACPTGVNAYLVAQVHQQHQQIVASTVVLSTLFCVFTIPLWLFIVNNL